MSTPSLRPLQLKTASCARLLKDLQFYQLEETRQREKIAKMNQNGDDPYLIKKQEEVLAETLQVIPNTHNRLRAAHRELRSLLHPKLDDEALAHTPEWKEALDIDAKIDKLIY